MVQRFTRKRLSSLRRAFGQTRWARAISRWRRARLRIPRALPSDPALLSDSSDARLLADALAWSQRRGEQPASDASPRWIPGRPPPVSSSGAIRNILLISHCDFTGSSALHVYKIATELHSRGLSPVIAVPGDPETVEYVGRPPFPVISYRNARVGRVHFPDGRGPDLVHAFTPRERVRKLASWIVARSCCPYVVHLEDNDRAVLSAELEANVEELEQLPASLLDRFIGSAQMHPLRGPHFVEQAAGVSVVIDRLLELAPADVPTAVVRPGFDEPVLSPDRPRDEVRAELGIRPSDFAVAYTGTIHTANLPDMRRLYVALAALRRDGHPIVFVKTGWNAPDAPELRQLGEALRNLGWLPRASLPSLLAAADVLVQPDMPGPFNDYRFPAKLPDFLASGKPVVLGRTNVGVLLEDGRDALVLENGTAAEIYGAVALLRERPELAREIGERGRAFALRELRWSTSVDSVEKLYGEVAASSRGAPPAWALELDPPVKAIALVSKQPDRSEAEAAREAGIYGFCFPPQRWSGEPILDFPFCFRVSGAVGEMAESALSQVSSPAYIRVSGEPLVLRDPLVESPRVASLQQLAAPLPDHVWFRSVAFPDNRTDASVYELVLRKLVLQTLGRSSAQEPVIFLDPGGELSRDVFLRVTRRALREGIRQFYASRGLDVSARDLEIGL